MICCSMVSDIVVVMMDSLVLILSKGQEQVHLCTGQLGEKLGI